MHCPQCGQENPPAAKFCSRCGAPLPVSAEPGAPPAHSPKGIAPAATPPIAIPKAGFWIRLGAAIIDGLIVGAASYVVRLPFIGLFRGAFAPNALFTAGLGFNFISIGALWLYFWLMTGLNRGQTVGKMAVGIKVVDKEGKTPTLGQAALREIVGKTISAIILYIGFLMIAWDKQKQGLHDKIAETYIVSTK